MTATLTAARRFPDSVLYVFVRLFHTSVFVFVTVHGRRSTKTTGSPRRHPFPARYRRRQPFPARYRRRQPFPARYRRRPTGVRTSSRKSRFRPAFATRPFRSSRRQIGRRHRTKRTRFFLDKRRFIIDIPRFNGERKVVSPGNLR